MLRVPTPSSRVGPLSAVLINSLVTQVDQSLIDRDNVIIRRNAPRLIAVSPELIGSAHLKTLFFKPCDGGEQARAGPQPVAVDFDPLLSLRLVVLDLRFQYTRVPDCIPL